MNEDASVAKQAAARQRWFFDRFFAEMLIAMGDPIPNPDDDGEIGRAEEHLRAILERRAAEISAHVDAPGEKGRGIEVVAFTRGRVFAAEIERLVEIRPLAPWARLPASGSANGSDYFGVLHVRGRAIAILDLAARFEIAASSPSECPYAVVVESDGIPIALAADEIGDVRVLELEAIRPASPGDSRGIGSVARGFADEVAILDVHRLVQSELASTGNHTYRE
jgi:chemotaxis signal transduction protein